MIFVIRESTNLPSRSVVCMCNIVSCDVGEYDNCIVVHARSEIVHPKLFKLLTWETHSVNHEQSLAGINCLHTNIVLIDWFGNWDVNVTLNQNPGG